MHVPLLSWFIGAASLVTFHCRASAAVVNIAVNSWSGAAPKVILTGTGQRLATDSVVRIGAFPNGIPSLAPDCSFAAIMAAFVPLGENSSDPADGTNGPLFVNNVNPLNPADAAGHFAGTITAVDNADPRFAPGTRLYIMVLDRPFESRFSATSMALYSDPTAYTIPASATRALVTSAIDSQSEVVVGTWNSNAIYMSAICPEPATAGLLSLFPAMALTARRTRRTSGLLS
ncbi:MAG TPA: hypothetical protein VG796_22225 [Verrucomicrobiales bacterium]|jgi:hypothetical protein|nr:hypothetical protein [Verrucomicrobiales bacterium]